MRAAIVRSYHSKIGADEPIASTVRFQRPNAVGGRSERIFDSLLSEYRVGVPLGYIVGARRLASVLLVVIPAPSPAEVARFAAAHHAVGTGTFRVAVCCRESVGHGARISVSLLADQSAAVGTALWIQNNTVFLFDSAHERMRDAAGHRCSYL